MKIKIIHNPVSGRGKAHRAVEAIGRLAGPLGYSPAFHQTKHPGDATKAAGQLDGFDALGVIGGDGTINESIQHLPADIPLLVFPFGNANVLAQEFHITKHCEATLKAWLNGQTRKMDLGLAGKRRFLLMAGAGFDAEIVNHVHENRDSTVSMAKYAKAFFHCLRYFNPPKLRLDVDGETVAEDKGFAVISNVKTYAWHMRMHPAADSSDGLFNLVFFNLKNRRQLLQSTANLVLGSHLDSSLVQTWTGKTFSIQSEEAAPLQLDGDRFGKTPCEISVIPKALTLVSPEFQPH